jgi:hypothetical protein
MAAMLRIFRKPDPRARFFLEILVREHEELLQQLGFCMVTDYDPTGWLDVRTTGGPPSPIRYRADGPRARHGFFGDPDALDIQSSISVNADGLLSAIEIIQNVPPDDPIRDPIELFINADRIGELYYPGSDQYRPASS